LFVRGRRAPSPVGDPNRGFGLSMSCDQGGDADVSSLPCWRTIKARFRGPSGLCASSACTRGRHGVRPLAMRRSTAYSCSLARLGQGVTNRAILSGWVALPDAAMPRSHRCYHGPATPARLVIVLRAAWIEPTDRSMIVGAGLVVVLAADELFEYGTACGVQRATMAGRLRGSRGRRPRAQVGGPSAFLCAGLDRCSVVALPLLER